MKKFTYSIVFALLASFIWGSNAYAQSITQRGATTTDNSITSNQLSFGKPTGLTVGDVMIVSIVQGDNDPNETVSAATSADGTWTVVKNQSIGSSGNNDWYSTVLYKVAVQADVDASNFVFNVNTIADGAVGGLMAFANVNTVGGVGPTGSGTGPFDVAAGAMQTGTTTDITAPSITPQTNNAAILMLAMGGDNNNFTDGNWSTTTPGGLNEILDANANSDQDECVGAAFQLLGYTTSGGTGSGSATMSANDVNGAFLIALKPANTFGAPNLWSVSGTGALRKYTMDPVAGTLLGGPAVVTTPLTSTAAVAKNQVTPFDADGCIYYLNRDDNNTLNGVVTVYSLRPDGTGHGVRGSFDMNGAGNNADFSFVRLGFDALGHGWILAGSDGSGNIYIASFQGNGVNAISNVNTFGNTSLTVASPGTSSEFQNGDLAITAGGTLYALANVTDGQTYVYTLNSLSTPTTLTRRWTVQDNGGTFSGSVNGLAWTQSGSLHFSTSNGIYFIDQFTANQGAGTVQATLVANTGGLSLTDLGSDKFPSQTTLPVKLSAFSVTKQGNNAILNWTTASEVNTSRFEIERSYDGVHFSSVGTKQANGNSTSDINYLYSDPISISSGIIYYRIKTVDIDGQFSYSKVVALRINGKTISSLTVYPNPFTTDLKVELNADKDASATLRLSNAAGQIVVSKNAQVLKGNNVIILSSELSTLNRGMYIVELITEDGKLTQKIIKK